MIRATAYNSKTIGVFGLARTGLAAVRALAGSGASVCAWDDNEARRAEVAEYTENLYELDFSALDALLLAPGVPLTHPEPHALVKKALSTQTPLISDLDVFQAARPDMPTHQLVAITGTNGKSTTTALIGHIVSACSKPCAVGGNIGTGVLALSPIGAGGVYVFELSSFQLDLTQNLQADVAVLLNVSPDHLDRHGTFENYLEAKKQLFQMQRKTSVAVVGVDDQAGRDVAKSLKQRVVLISGYGPVDGGVYVDAGALVDATSGTADVVGDIAAAPALQGQHNWQNAAAAYAVCRQIGIAPEDIFAALLSFSGLEHRQQIIAVKAGVRFVNDSKATNSDAAVRALRSFDNIHWIAGGRAKEADFKAMKPHLSKVKASYFIGEAAAQLAHDLPDGVVASFQTLDDAFEAACAAAQKGDTILLSPACTAFDQYQNFEIRGAAFAALIAALPNTSETGERSSC